MDVSLNCDSLRAKGVHVCKKVTRICVLTKFWEYLQYIICPSTCSKGIANLIEFYITMDHNSFIGDDLLKSSDLKNWIIFGTDLNSLKISYFFANN